MIEEKAAIRIASQEYARRFGQQGECVLAKRNKIGLAGTLVFFANCDDSKSKRFEHDIVIFVRDDDGTCLMQDRFESWAPWWPPPKS